MQIIKDIKDIKFKLELVVGNKRGYIGIHRGVQGGWNSRPSTSIGIGGSIRF